MYRYGLALLISLGIVISASADIYKWTDPNGVTHYSDIPGSTSAVQVQVPSEQNNNPTMTSAPSSGSSSISSFPGGSGDNSIPASAPPPATVAPNSHVPPPHVPYASVRILEPTAEYTYVNNESGEVIVKVQLTPQLQPGDMIQLLLDGSPAGQPQATSSLKVENMDRGQHTVQVNVVDSSGQTVATSNVVNFYMQRIAIPHHSGLNTTTPAPSNLASTGLFNQSQTNSNQTNSSQVPAPGVNPPQPLQSTPSPSPYQTGSGEDMAANPASNA